MIYFEFVQQDPVEKIHDVIIGRIYCGTEFNPGLVAYYPDSWLELWMRLGKPEIRGKEILEECLSNFASVTSVNGNTQSVNSI